MSNIFSVKRVPGLLTPDERAAGVKQFADEYRANTGVLKNSAFDFAEKVISEDLRPRTELDAGKMPKPVGVEGATPKQPKGILGDIGTLAPGSEEQLREQSILIRDAVANEQFEQDAVDFREAAAARQAEVFGEVPLSDDPAERAWQLQKRLEAKAARMAPLADAQDTLERVTNTPPTQTWWRNAVDVGMRSVAQTLWAIPQGVVNAWELHNPLALLQTATGGDPQPTIISEWANAVDKSLTELLPGDPARSKEFFSQLASGTGSMAAYGIAAFVGNVIGLPAGVTAAVAGGFSVANQMYEESQQFGARGLQKYLSFYGGFLLGVSEGLPLEGAIRRATVYDRAFFAANKESGGALVRLLNNTSASSLEEFIQEFGQSAGQDLIAKHLYDPDRELDVLEWAQQGVIGGIVGAGVGTLTTALAENGTLKGEPVANVDPEVQQRIAEAVIQKGKQQVDEILAQGGEDIGDAADAAPADAAAQAGAGEGAAAPVPGAATQPEAPRSVVADPVKQIIEQQRAFHGTPHKFDKFSMSKIGTGEGAQAYGHGLYFAGNRRVAEGYQSRLAGEPKVTLNGEQVDIAEASEALGFSVGSTEADMVRFALREMRDGADLATAVRHSGVAYGQPIGSETQARVLQAMTEANAVAQPGGALYTVDIPDDAELLDWDAPLSEQPEALRNKLNALRDAYNANRVEGQRVMETFYPDQDWTASTLPDDITGETLYDALAMSLGGQEAASKALLEAGIPGLRYLDAGSRADGDGTRNYVIFDENRIQIEDVEAQTGTPINPDIAAQIDAVQLSPAQLAPLPNIEKGLTGPIPRVVQAAKAYAAAIGLPHRRAREYVKVDTARAARIAQAYAEMKHEPDDPAVQAAYRALAEETIAQYQYVKASGIKIETILPGQPDPYPNGPRDVLRDIAAGHIWYFPTDQGFGSSDFDHSGNPLLEATDEVSDNGQPMVVNDLFRVVHDFFGHGLEGSGFGARGEENAWQSHMRLFTASAVPAMTSETRGQNSWVNFGPFGEQNRKDRRNTVYADQKAGLLPSWTWTEGVVDSTAEDIDAPVELVGDGLYYHGTSREFEGRLKLPGARGSGGNAIFLSTSPVQAIAFARGETKRLLAAKVNAKKVFNYQNEEDLAALADYVTKNFDAVAPGALYSPQTAISFLRSGDFGLLEQPAVRKWMRSKGYDSFWVREYADSPLNIGVLDPAVIEQVVSPQQQFLDAFLAAKNASPYGAAVHAYSAAEYAKMRTFLAPDGLSGFALKGEDIVSVFSHPASGGGRARKIIDTAVANGGRTLDAFDGKLVQIYAALGFREVRREAWNDAYKPEGWKDEWGKPDVVYMEYDGDIERSVASVGTQSEAFKKWFGQSKVVDEAGQPLVVYHGSPVRGIRAFDPARVGDNFGYDEKGFFFTSDDRKYPGSAREYAGRDGEVYPVYLSLQNPYTLEQYAADFNTDVAGIINYDGEPQALITVFDGDRNEIIKRATEGGYDGIAFVYQHEDGYREGMYVAFEPTQIKSVNNVGTYDPNDPDILRMIGTSAIRQPYALEPTRPQAGVAAQPDDTPYDNNLTNLGRSFAKLLNMTVRQRLSSKGRDTMGEYHRRTSVVRLRAYSDFSTLAHEGGHFLNDAMEAANAQFFTTHAKELRKIGVALYGADLSQAPARQQQREGFAEFMRVYITARAAAKAQWPQLTADFETALRDFDSRLLDGFNGLTTAFEGWLNQPSTSLARNMIVSGFRRAGLSAAWKELKEHGAHDFMREVYIRSHGALVNRFSALNSLVDEVMTLSERNRGVAMEVQPDDNPAVLARLATNVGNRAMQSIKQGVLGYKSTMPMSRGLDAVMLRLHDQPLDSSLQHFDEDRVQDFDAYLAMRRALAEYVRFEAGEITRPPIDASKGEVIQAIKDFEAKYGDAFREAAQWTHEYGMALWQLQYDAGIIDRDTYAEGRKRAFYVPLQRDVSDRRHERGAQSSLTAGDRLIRGPRFKGSGRQIISPLAVLMEKTYAVERIIVENEVRRTLAVLADRAGGAGAIVERVPATQLVGTQVNAIEAAGKLLGGAPTEAEIDDYLKNNPGATRAQAIAVLGTVHIDPIDAQDMLTLLSTTYGKQDTFTIFRSEQAASVGQNALFFWENGKMAAIVLKDGEIGRDVVNTLNAVGHENMDMVISALAATSGVFRSAITLWPDFIIMNFLRDQPAAWILTEGYTPFISGIRGVVDEVMRKQIAKDYNAAMGTLGGMSNAALHASRVQRDIRTLGQKGLVVEAFGDVHSPWDVTGFLRGMARFTELAETGTRLGVFRAAYDRAVKEGLSEYSASIEAAYLATDLMDFGLNGGAPTEAVRRLIPFLNAQVQGLYKMVRTLGADEVSRRRGLRFAMGAYFKDINKLPVSRAEKRALRVGRKAWLKMLSLGLISAALHFLFEDDEDYQEATEYIRATHWVIPMAKFGGKPGEIFTFPKPFELAIFANATERMLEFAGGDPTALERFKRGLMHTLVPPAEVPVIGLSYELLTNTDLFTGREIVPSHMQGLAPYLQYDQHTSNMAKWLGGVTGTSPMVVDHMMSGIFAGAWRDTGRVIDNMDPARPAMQASDAPLLRRLLRDTRSGSLSVKDFYEQASARGSVLSRALSTYKTEFDAGNTYAANLALSRMTEDEKGYALLMTHFEAKEKRLHPFYRLAGGTKGVIPLVNTLRREIAGPFSLTDTSVEEDVPARIPLSPQQKADLDDALSDLIVRETRNTLVAMKVPGWADREMVDTQPTLDLIYSISPAAGEELERRWQKAKIYDAREVFEAWPEVRDRLIYDREEADLSDLVAVASAGL